MILLAYGVEILLKRWPIANFVAIGISIVLYVMTVADILPDNVLLAMILDGWNPVGMLGYQFLHADFLHLAGNMYFLWIFGNAVCEKTGSIRFAISYILCGVVAAVVHNIFCGETAIGASGAVNGVIGMYLVIYPVNNMRCFYWILVRAGTFVIPGFWIILLWFVQDAWSAYRGVEHGIAYWAHIGGFLAGLTIAWTMAAAGWLNMARYDNPTLLDLMGRKKHSVVEERPTYRSVADMLKNPPPGVEQKPRAPAERRKLQAIRPLPPPTPPPKPFQPPEPAMLNFDCPHCSQNLDVPQEFMGQTIQCPACNKQIKIETE